MQEVKPKIRNRKEIALVKILPLSCEISSDFCLVNGVRDGHVFVDSARCRYQPALFTATFYIFLNSGGDKRTGSEARNSVFNQKCAITSSKPTQRLYDIIMVHICCHAHTQVMVSCWVTRLLSQQLSTHWQQQVDTSTDLICVWCYKVSC